MGKRQSGRRRPVENVRMVNGRRQADLFITPINVAKFIYLALYYASSVK